MHRTLLSCCSLSALLCLFGCSSSDSINPAPVPDTSTEAGPGDASNDAASEPEAAPLTIPDPIPATEPQPLPTGDWVVAGVSDTDDPVYPYLESGTFVLPKPDDVYADQTWQAVTPGEHGELKDTWTPLIYSAVSVAVPDGARLFARADRIAGLYVNNLELQPGDLYASGRIRVPVDAKADTLLVARAIGLRGAPAVELWTTPDELHFNVEDATLPDLVVGQTYEQWIGIPVLNLTDTPVVGLRAVTLGSDLFAEAAVEHASLPPHAVSQVAFRLQPTQAPAPQDGGAVKVRLRLEPPGFQHSYERDVDLPVVAADAVHRRTRRSQVDGSVQFYGVLPPAGFAPGQSYGLILSLHGAGVDAAGQAAAYGPKSWAWLVAPTNRRPFGFDWEEWGRRDGLEALDHAMQAYSIDPTRVHLTGHSMGGHGSWHLGVHFTGRFATIGPSAGWSSFESYGGSKHPAGVVGRAREASKTLDFVPNLTDRAVYILHGDADDNVPISEAQLMFGAVSKVTTDIVFHTQPGAGHWWDDDPNVPGAACVDWGPMMTMMEARTLEPTELDFTFRTPAPWVSPTRSYLTIRSCLSPMQDCEAVSKKDGTSVTLTTTNVRSLTLDGAALAAKGITTVFVDGKGYPIAGAPVEVGTADGKTLDVSGPLNQAFVKPFCFVYGSSSPAFKRHASWLASTWSVIGNGQACALAFEQLTPSVRDQQQLVYIGVPSKALPAAEALGVSWDDAGIHLTGHDYPGAIVWMVFPENQRLSAAIGVAAGKEYLLQRYHPFSSRSGMPDWFVYDETGRKAAGFFSPEWKLDPASSEF